MNTNFLKLSVLILSFLTVSCSNDDDNNSTQINLQDLQVTIDENPNNGDIVGTVQSNSTTALTFSIVSQTPASALEIDAATGELTVLDAGLFDFETNPTITATVSASGAQNQALITINLNNIAEVNVQNFNSTIDENPTTGQSLGTVNANGDAPLNYSIATQSPSGALSISSATGELTVLNATLFDFETNPTITATVQVDNSGTIENLTVTIDLLDRHEVGEYKFGGVIFWVNANGDEGYVIATTDQSSGTEWGCSNISIQGATGTSIGSGINNTIAIESGCLTPGIAADLSANLILNGYNDWFLPSKDEMYEVFLNKNIINATCIANGGTSMVDDYWTSTEYDVSNAWFQVFLTSGQFATGKFGNNPNVRSARHWTDF